MVNYKCNKCNKEFKYESDFKRHNNRKTLCNKKEELKCEICNVFFTCPYNKQIHEKTKKHLDSINKVNNNISECDNLSDTKNIIKNLKEENSNLKSQICDLQFQINNLYNIINNIESENLELKSNNKLHTRLEYIYIIHPIQCINMNIYKVGRTNNIINRHKQYPKGSELLFTIPCKNSKLVEQEILNYLKQNTNYHQIKKYGNEYFKCEINMLINDIQKLVNNIIE